MHETLSQKQMHARTKRAIPGYLDSSPGFETEWLGLRADSLWSLIPPFVRQWQQAIPRMVAIQPALTMCAGPQCLPITD